MIEGEREAGREREGEREQAGSLVNECWFWGTCALCELHLMINDKFPLHFADDDRDAMQTYCLSYSNAKYIVIIGGCESPLGYRQMQHHLSCNWTPGRPPPATTDASRGREQTEGEAVLIQATNALLHEQSITCG